MSKVGRKGITFIPKAAREHVGIDEETVVVIESDGEKITIRPLKVVRVKATPKLKRVVEEALLEEQLLEKEKVEACRAETLRCSWWIRVF